MKKLTKVEALKICVRLWTWLAKHPDCFKEDWPGWKRLAPYHMDCPCCEYRDQHSRHLCGLKCLIEWPGGGCCSDESPFDAWDCAWRGDIKSRKIRAASAPKVAALARKALRKHTRKKS